jgi:Na+-driven multidrug efflux pump
VLLLAAVILSTNLVLGATLSGLGRPLDQGIGELIALAGTAASLAVLLPWLGLLGAAIASVIAYAISMAWMVHRLRARLGPEIVRLWFSSLRLWPWPYARQLRMRVITTLRATLARPSER